MSDEFDYMTAVEMRRHVVQKNISPVELTRRALDKAAATQDTLNAFSLLLPETAMLTAHQAEDAVMKGAPCGLLHGVPFSVKDLIAVGGVQYASGSKATEDTVAKADAPSVERAKRAGAILIGKTTTSEFGCKCVGDSPLTGITRNPWDPRKTPGGSSAGAASSVAAGITPLALGTDGGGSIRIPSSFTGLFGLKANFGRVPVWPTSATPTLAHVGPMTRTVEDASLLLTAIAGYDSRDPFSIATAVPDLLGACRASPAGLRVAWSPTLGYARPDPRVVAICEKAAKRFEDMGCHVETIDEVFSSDPADIWIAEFYAGVGTRLRPFLEGSRKILDPAVADVLASALNQEMRDYYTKVFERYSLRDRILGFFERFDILLSPVLPVSSLDTGINIPGHLHDRNLVTWAFYTYPFNLTGQPAASICAGFDDDGMPIGLQLIARGHGEYDLLRAAAAFERSHIPAYNIRQYSAS